jgi:hypothetical protein
MVYNLSVAQSNLSLNSLPKSGFSVQRPVAEYEDAGYVLFYDLSEFASADVKAKLVENLPDGVTAVIYSDSNDASELEGLYRYYSQLAPSPEQVKVIYIPNIKDDGYSGTGFWTRDTIPVPVMQSANSVPLRAMSEVFSVVDAKYYHGYEPDKYISEYFNADLISHNYEYEGGNFMANAKGDCLVINTSPVSIIPDDIFSKFYGCLNLIRLPYLKGIGHADESVKFVSDDHVLTDDRRYQKILEGEGFTVTLLPRPKREYETYLNSLIINGTVWVPIFKQTTDTKAMDVYKSLGLKVIAADSSILSNEGAGSIHCTTMTYPKTTDFNEILAYFGAKDVTSNSSVDASVIRKVKELENERKEQIERLNRPNIDSYLDSLY